MIETKTRHFPITDLGASTFNAFNGTEGALMIFPERLLFDSISMHNPAMDGDRQTLHISVHEETVDLAVRCKKE